MRGESRATNTMFAGIQMILPGEVAPVHRHVSSAIRSRASTARGPIRRS